MFTLFNSQVKMLLYRHFPQHHGYCEPFGRSRAALFAKPVVAVEVQNDLNPGLTNYFRVLKNAAIAINLTMALQLTPNLRQEHAECRKNYPAKDPEEWARPFKVLTRKFYCLCHWRSQSQTNPVVMAVKAKETQC